MLVLPRCPSLQRLVVNVILVLEDLSQCFKALIGLASFLALSNISRTSVPSFHQLLLRINYEKPRTLSEGETEQSALLGILYQLPSILLARRLKSVMEELGLDAVRIETCGSPELFCGAKQFLSRVTPYFTFTTETEVVSTSVNRIYLKFNF